MENIKRFFKFSDNKLYHDFAYVQFITGCRVQEIAGLQKKSVDFKNKCLLIKDVVMWSHAKKFLSLKSTTKNGEAKRVPILDDKLLEILLFYCNSGDSNYVFSLNSQSLSYRGIQGHNTRTLRKANLHVDNCTHFLRHSMASIIRQDFGSIEAVQAILGQQGL